MIFWSTKSQHHPAYQNFCLHFTSHVWWVGGQIEISSFFKRFYQNKNYIFGQQMVNITQHTKSFVYVLLLKHGGWVGELKYQVFPKDFIKI